MSENQLVVLKGSDYGLEETKAQEIQATFTPMLEKMTALEKEYNLIVKKDISEEVCMEARALRFEYRDVRTGTAKIHKKLKDFYLKGGRFVDGWKNAQLMASQGMESALKEIENHYENIEIERIAKLQEERIELLHKYEPEMNVPSLGEMEEAVWNNYINGVKLNYNARIDAEKKVETDRIEKERTDELHNKRKGILLPYWQFVANQYKSANFGEITESMFRGILQRSKDGKKKWIGENARIQEENVRLNTESKKKEKRNNELRPFIIFIRDYDKMVNMEESEYQKELADIKKGAEQHYKLETEKKAQAEAKLKAEREEKEKLLKADADRKAEAAAQLKAQEDEERESALAPDKEKLLKLAETIGNIPLPQVGSEEANDIIRETMVSLSNISEQIRESCEQL